MAITYPLELPATGVASELLRIQHLDAMAPDLAGRVAGVSLGFPLWRPDYALGEQEEGDADHWQAVFDALRGGKFQFKARSYRRPYPKAYPSGFAGMDRAGGGAFNGDTSWSADDDRMVFTLGATPGDDLPDGFLLARGDLIGFRYASGAKSTFVRCVEATTADGDGELTVTVEPPLPAVVPSNATAYLDEPWCLARMIGAESGMGEFNALHEASGRLVGIQDLT